MRHAWRVFGQDQQGREVCLCQQCGVKRIELSSTTDAFLYPSGETRRVTKSGGVPPCRKTDAAAVVPDRLPADAKRATGAVDLVDLLWRMHALVHSACLHWDNAAPAGSNGHSTEWPAIRDTKNKADDLISKVPS